MDYSSTEKKGILSDFYYCSLCSEFIHSNHVHSHIEFVFSLKNTAEVETVGKIHHISPGNVLIIMPYETHSYRIKETSKAFIFACPPDYVPECRQILINKKFNPQIISFSDTTKAIIEDIIKSDFEDNLKKKALLYCIVSEFFQSSAICENNSTEFYLYRKATAYISEHFTESISLDSVAKHFCITPSHLSRIINKSAGAGFSDILNSLRINHAQKLFNNGETCISDVAFESGFGTIRNFNRIFKKQFKMTPKEYIQKKVNLT